jgi:hypothetical protein
MDIKKKNIAMAAAIAAIAMGLYIYSIFHVFTALK